MTLDEAIKHCLEVAEQKDIESLTDRWNDGDEWSESIKEDCKQCAADHRQLAEWLKELKEAKRLLKAAVEDFKVIGKVLDADCDILINCEECPLQSGHYNCRSWNHQDEALALIGEDTNVPASADDTNVGGKIDSWISVKDRLPDEDGWYLVCKHNRVRVAEWCKDCWYNESDLPIDDCAITYWQSLPEPPKDGDTNG